MLLPSCNKDDLELSSISDMDGMTPLSSSQKDKIKIVKDVDGNWYGTVIIGTQIWMTENLRTTRFNDKEKIPMIKNNAEWSALTTPAFCWYDNNKSEKKEEYGALYNWYAVATEKLCPVGWRVASVTDWIDLANNLGGVVGAGEKLKEAGTEHWISPNIADNSSGFTALPGGLRGSAGFGNRGYRGFWWTSTQMDYLTAHGACLTNNSADWERNDFLFRQGFSVRCLKED